MYTIYFDDGSYFDGGEPNDSKWNNMSIRPIAMIEYRINRTAIDVCGYEAYNHEVERVTIIDSGKETITRVILSLKEGKYVTRLSYDLRTKKTNVEIVYADDLKTTGWKKGLKGKGSYSIKLDKLFGII